MPGAGGPGRGATGAVQRLGSRDRDRRDGRAAARDRGGDLDERGDADLVVGNGFNDSVTLFLRERHTPSGYRAETLHPGTAATDNFSTVTVAIGRLNGRTGLAVANQRDDTVAVFTRRGGWEPFARAIVSTVTADGGHGPDAVAVADLDGDRLPDIATANGVSGDVTLLTNTTRARR